MVQVVSIAIVVVAGLVALALVPYVQAYRQVASAGTRQVAQAAPEQESGARTIAAQTASRAQADAMPLDLKAQSAASERQDASARGDVQPTPRPTPQPTPPPESESARTLEAVRPSDGAGSAAQVVTGVMPSISPPPVFPENLEPPAGLTLAPMSPFVADYALIQPVYPDGGMPIPALIQHDYKTPVATMNGRNISVWTSGCGADAVSMVVSYLTGETKQTPYTLFRWAAEHGFYKGSGLEHEALTQLASLYGVNSQWIEPDKDAILQALSSGRPVIAHMGRGFFTSNGHYIVLRGIAPDGTIYVNDPAKLENCYPTYPLDQIIEESKSDDPFMICAGPETSER